MVALNQHRGDLNGHGTIMEVIYGGSGTPLSVIRLYRMDVTPKKALDMHESLHLIIPYLLRNE